MSQPDPNRDGSKKIDWFEFWVRFVCGTVFGMILSVRFVLVQLWLSENHAVLALVSLGASLVCGLAAARYGDRFWTGR